MGIPAPPFFPSIGEHYGEIGIFKGLCTPPGNGNIPAGKGGGLRRIEVIHVGQIDQITAVAFEEALVLRQPFLDGMKGFGASSFRP